MSDGDAAPASPAGVDRTSRSALPARPGLVGFRISATGSAGVDWSRLDATWARAGELPVFDAGWMSDHLSDAAQDRGGPAFEALTTAAALAHRVPGKWVGIAVVSATFRHPAVVAKAATVLDHATDGRFVLGMGAGWHAGEHDAFGVTLPPMGERYDRFEASVETIAALYSDAARRAPGVSLDAGPFRLRGATNDPPPVRPGGPPIWLGVGRPRGIALAARLAQGWPMPGNRPGDVAYFARVRDELRRALELAGRDPDEFTFAAQLSCGTTAATRAEALATARAFVAAGANHVILGLPASVAPEHLDAMAREVAEPLAAAGARGSAARPG